MFRHNGIDVVSSFYNISIGNERLAWLYFGSKNFSRGMQKCKMRPAMKSQP